MMMFIVVIFTIDPDWCSLVQLPKQQLGWSCAWVNVPLKRAREGSYVLGNVGRVVCKSHMGELKGRKLQAYPDSQSTETTRSMYLPALWASGYSEPRGSLALPKTFGQRPRALVVDRAGALGAAVPAKVGRPVRWSGLLLNFEYVCVYIYIYISLSLSLSLSIDISTHVCVCIYIYIWERVKTKGL